MPDQTVFRTIVSARGIRLERRSSVCRETQTEKESPTLIFVDRLRVVELQAWIFLPQRRLPTVLWRLS